MPCIIVPLEVWQYGQGCFCGFDKKKNAWLFPDALIQKPFSLFFCTQFELYITSKAADLDVITALKQHPHDDLSSKRKRNHVGLQDILYMPYVVRFSDQVIILHAFSPL